MQESKRNNPPKWMFAAIAGGAFMASGIYIGIFTAKGFIDDHLAKAILFCVLGLLMSRAAYAQR